MRPSTRRCAHPLEQGVAVRISIPYLVAPPVVARQEKTGVQTADRVRLKRRENLLAATLPVKTHPPL